MKRRVASCASTMRHCHGLGVGVLLDRDHVALLGRGSHQRPEHRTIDRLQRRQRPVQPAVDAGAALRALRIDRRAVADRPSPDSASPNWIPTARNRHRPASAPGRWDSSRDNPVRCCGRTPCRHRSAHKARSSSLRHHSTFCTLTELARPQILSCALVWHGFAPDDRLCCGSYRKSSEKARGFVVVAAMRPQKIRPHRRRGLISRL